MARIVRDISWLIGRTPLVEINRLAPDGGGRLLAKLDFKNPGGSNKDRAVLGMLQHAERSGFLKPGGTIIEASAGDTGFSLAMLASARGYRLTLVMPSSVPEARRRTLAAYGCAILETPREDGMAGALQKAETLARETPGTLVLQPFSNRANAEIHHNTTAREIWEDTDGQVDMVVCPVGTGGTAAGCLSFFREQAPHVEVWAVEPAACAVLSGQRPGHHGIPGLGCGFVPEILTPTELHGVVQVSEEEACRGLRSLAEKEAILAGPASGAVFHAARHLAAKSENRGKQIVAVLPDDAERFSDHIAFATCAHGSDTDSASEPASKEPSSPQ